MSSPVPAPPPILDSEKTPMLRHTALAICAPAPTSPQYIFFQDINGGIRKATYEPDKHSEENALASSVIDPAGNAKWHTPLAAAAYEIGCPCKFSHTDKCHKKHIPKVYLFYVNNENFIRSAYFNGEMWTTASEFNKKLIKVHANTNLAALSHQENSAPAIRIFYQAPDRNIKEYILTATQPNWTPGDATGAAMIGSRIAASISAVAGEFSVFFQEPSGRIRRIKKQGQEAWKPVSVSDRVWIPQVAIASVYVTSARPPRSSPSLKSEPHGTRLYMLPMINNGGSVMYLEWVKENDTIQTTTTTIEGLDGGAIPFSQLASLVWVHPTTGTRGIKVLFQMNNHRLAFFSFKADGIAQHPLPITGAI